MFSGLTRTVGKGTKRLSAPSVRISARVPHTMSKTFHSDLSPVWVRETTSPCLP